MIVVRSAADPPGVSTPRRAASTDSLIALALAVASAAYLVWAVDFHQSPAEDAAMLLRYAQHLAAGHGMVWNIGERPIDGATDLLFALAVAAVSRVGVSVETAARLLGAVAHAATVFLVFLLPRRLFRAPRLACLLSAAFLAVGPAKGYVAACFGTPVFAALAAAAFGLTMWSVAAETSDAPYLLGATAVVLGLVRPEGAILGLTLIGTAALVHDRGAGPFLWRASAVFVLLGSTYFAARWRYFGHPFPNPYYVKGGGRLHWDMLALSVHNATRLAGPFLLALPVGLLTRTGMRRLVVTAVPIVVFVAIWVLIADRTNYMMRFQYPIVPIVLIGWPGLVAAVPRQWYETPWRAMPHANRGALIAGCALLAVGLIAWQHRATRYSMVIEGPRVIADRLSRFRGAGYAMVTSEAGLLPLYSGWTAIDAFGLNDEEIARTGRISSTYLDRYRPAVIIFHAYFSPLVSAPPGRAQDAIAKALDDYAARHAYVLAACFGLRPDDTFYYYVRPDVARTTSLAREIRDATYLYASGEKAIDFARFRRAGAGG